MVDRTFNVLVAEDEAFQRLALLDILTLCDYDAVPFENGKLALEALKDETNNFDLVLLDLYMPEMDGFEVLSHMQVDPRLREIPVVVMSANDSNEIIGNCLKMGAKDFLVKPIRITQCKGLLSKMKSQSDSAKKPTSGLAKYQTIKEVGRGNAGTVTLVLNNEDGMQYALKTINLRYIDNEKDRKNAESESQFLRVLKGPTLIRFYESFVQNGVISIVMEFAEGGSLAQKIQQAIVAKKKFTTEEILSFTAQIVLGVLAMHSKNILHRDIKSQNIFITKTGILKLGDFGIAKQLEGTIMTGTITGTPYNMAPEVCNRKKYDSKADVWSIGVILYELITLKKPFDADNVNDLFHVIINKPLDPLPQSVDSDLQMLCGAMLNKDHMKRPDTFEIAKIPCVKKAIIKFVEEHKCRDEVIDIIDLDEPKPSP